ncbi:DNA repair protein rad18 [Lophiostoma macrostomum CBS 122681]|uniref:Postreplication repair E3 ubiquitin-protein ligase RAD18 n=1 Tax=Lophiostoma macrostomum CBS 122681 TaxID=1314788 RepID=A0A6A6TFQ3_9PLEO|nr:DNA repair protein rad18 [Lophiostoma macrostomum CBS 122681]
MDSSFDLPDSTDWISTSLPTFAPIEAALRCEVCKEFYENPVITSCSHTFCSLCIRRCISSDGKCPACKTVCSTDKLLPNYVVREVAIRFQEARPKALELARQDKEKDETIASGGKAAKKRKFDDAAIEDESPRRNTRSRTTRSSQRSNDMRDVPIEVKDSEDEGDEEFVPEGFARCPMCQRPKKVEDMWQHTASCNGEPEPAAGQSTRSRHAASNSDKHQDTHDSARRAARTQPNALQHRRKELPPPMSRLPTMNYALLNESKLKKKLQELGISASGKKELLIRRHTEWLHLWNSNCDASDDRRKTKRELLKELDTWERTQGGNASTSTATVMRKDFDSRGHASTHKSQFDDLIANARKKRTIPAENRSEEDSRPEQEVKGAQMVDRSEKTSTTDPQTGSHSNSDVAKPYEGNETALASIREKVAQTKLHGTPLPSLNHESASMSNLSTNAVHAAHEGEPGIQDPFSSPSRKLPMFSLPEEPVIDVESSTTVQ